MTTFTLDTDTARGWAVAHGLLPVDAEVVAEELAGGVSATVVALRLPGDPGIVVKQALPRLRVADEWLATQARTETEADAMRLCGALTPGAVPRVLGSDPVDHVLALELVEGCANWQADVAEGKVHAELGAWAGATLGTWHERTSHDPGVQARFADLEAFEELRLRPFHETMATRLPEAAPLVAPRVGQLRHERSCLVHGDYALKNMLVGPSGPWVLDFEVAHLGNPLFDLGFFLSFAVLSALRWPARTDELRELADGFSAAYEQVRGAGSGTGEDVVAHTACLVLARTDGKSPAQFLDPHTRERARARGLELLREPARGLWE